jgi:hypothetical protein
MTPPRRAICTSIVCSKSAAGLNQFAGKALSTMPQPDETSTGPMNVQPVERSNRLMQQQATTPATTRKPRKAANEASARADAVRIAKAKISRRGSLRKQRQALKD